jgi:hypothetical protein
LHIQLIFEGKTMTLISSKKDLDDQLGTDKTLLILFGSEVQTIDVYNKAKQMKDNNELDERHVPLRMEDLNILTPTQKQDWTAASGNYVVLRMNKDGVRDIISDGSVTKFFTEQNKPGKTKIQLAFRGRL